MSEFIMSLIPVILAVSIWPQKQNSQKQKKNPWTVIVLEQSDAGAEDAVHKPLLFRRKRSNEVTDSSLKKKKATGFLYKSHNSNTIRPF